MKTIEIKGWIFAEVNECTGGLDYKFASLDYEQWALEGDPFYAKYTKLCEHTITAEVPDNIDPAAAMIRALEGQRDAARAAFNLKIREINDKIAQLQALPFHPA